MTEDSVTIDLSGLEDTAKKLIRTMAHLATMKGEPSHISQPSLAIMQCITRIELARKEGKSTYYHYRWDVSGKLYSPYREIMVAAFKLYQESTDWQANREKAFEKSKGLCVECGEPVKFAHHTSYENWALGDYELLDLEGRCGRCHSRAHKRGKDIAVPFFARRDPKTGYIPQDKMDALANRVML